MAIANFKENPRLFRMFTHHFTPIDTFAARYTARPTITTTIRVLFMKSRI